MSTDRVPLEALPEVGASVSWAGQYARVVGYRATLEGLVRAERRGRLTYLVIDLGGRHLTVRPHEVDTGDLIASGRIAADRLRPGDRIVYGDRTIPVVRVTHLGAEGTLVAISTTERVEFPFGALTTIAPRSAA